MCINTLHFHKYKLSHPLPPTSYLTNFKIQYLRLVTSRSKCKWQVECKRFPKCPTTQFLHVLAAWSRNKCRWTQRDLLLVFTRDTDLGKGHIDHHHQFSAPTQGNPSHEKHDPKGPVGSGQKWRGRDGLVSVPLPQILLERCLDGEGKMCQGREEGWNSFCLHQHGCHLRVASNGHLCIGAHWKWLPCCPGRTLGAMEAHPSPKGACSLEVVGRCARSSCPFPQDWSFCQDHRSRSETGSDFEDRNWFPTLALMPQIGQQVDLSQRLSFVAMFRSGKTWYRPGRWQNSLHRNQSQRLHTLY